MPIDVKISHQNKEVKVTTQGQLVTGNLKFSTPTAKTLEEPDTPVEIVPPLTGNIIIINDIILYANRNVGVNDATVTIYESEASAVAQTGADKTIFTQEVLKQSTVVLTGLNWTVAEGKFLNAVTDDDDVFVNVACYYAPI